MTPNATNGESTASARSDTWARADVDGRLPDERPRFPRARRWAPLYEDPPLPRREGLPFTRGRRAVIFFLHPLAWAGCLLLAFVGMYVLTEEIAAANVPPLLAMIGVAALCFRIAWPPRGDPSRLRFVREVGSDSIVLTRPVQGAEIFILGAWTGFFGIAFHFLVVAVEGAPPGARIALGVLIGAPGLLLFGGLMRVLRSRDELRFDRESIEVRQTRGLLTRTRRHLAAKTSDWRPIRISFRPAVTLARDPGTRRLRVVRSTGIGGPRDPFAIEFLDEEGRRRRVFEWVPMGPDEAREVLAGIALHVPVAAGPDEIDRLMDEGLARLLRRILPFAAREPAPAAPRVGTPEADGKGA